MKMHLYTENISLESWYELQARTSTNIDFFLTR